jgi:hypothetical protein
MKKEVINNWLEYNKKDSIIIKIVIASLICVAVILIL